MGFFDQMKQLQEMKSKVDDIKRKMETIEVVEQNEKVRVVVDGNRRVKSLEILDNSASSDFIVSAINKALEEADRIIQKEMIGAMPFVP